MDAMYVNEYVLATMTGYMRYHHEKPHIYLSMYGQNYICDHPVYTSYTLYKNEGKGLDVIQQRYNPITKSTTWKAIDS